MKNFLATLLCSFLLYTFTLAQETTVGLISYDISQAYQGYTLIYPHNQSSVFLLDNCGEIVHEWVDDDTFRPGNSAYLLEDGTLARAKRNADISMDAIWAGGGGEIIELVSWDNEILWSYTLNNEEERLHHDFSVMPNGNFLVIAWERITNEEAIAAGRDSMLLNQIDLWPDFVREINPSNDEIVWEWRSWDHLIQDFDSTKANYGNVAEEFRKIDVNFDTRDGASDWMHINALDYNPMLDQIMLSVPYFNEIWIIDHSTTTEQAMTDRGGRSNHGGDLLYRLGNPETYRRSDIGEQILFGQHDAHWANSFLPENHPDFGKLVCFNNNNPGGYSSIEIFESEWNMYTSDYETFDNSFPPYEFTNTITHPDTFALSSSGLSSAQILPNGNLLACSGRFGYIVEMTPNQEIVWEYIVPRMGTMEVEQGTVLSINNNLTFRAFKYPEDYSAFDGKDLSSKGFIELNPIEDYCNRLVATSTPEETFSMLYPNPANDMVHLTWDSGRIIDIEVFDLVGRKRIHEKGNGGMKYLDISDLEPNIYFIRIDDKKAMRLIKN